MPTINTIVKTWNVEDVIKRRDKCLELYSRAQALIEEAHQYDSFRLDCRGEQINYDAGLDIEKIRKR